jgi:hypothetical protein
MTVVESLGTVTMIGAVVGVVVDVVVVALCAIRVVGGVVSENEGRCIAFRCASAPAPTPRSATHTTARRIARPIRR